jgi:hypothetical protein
MVEDVDVMFGFKLIHISDLNNLYGKIMASKHRLINIEVVNTTKDKIEYNEILNILSEAEVIIKKIT